MKNISIITACLNAESTIERTINSITEQTYHNIEHIIIDGGSTDSTLDIINTHDKRITYWISEKDGGIADAMNKGLAHANGDYILFIHADDYLINEHSLENIARHLDDEHDVYIYPVYFESEYSRKLSMNRGFSWHTNFKMGSCHQGQICSRKLFNRIGGFDSSFNIGMDYDFILRAYRAGASALSINKPHSVMSHNGISSRKCWAGQYERLNDERKAHYKNTESVVMEIVYSVYWAFYLFFRKTMHTLHIPGYY